MMRATQSPISEEVRARTYTQFLPSYRKFHPKRSPAPEAIKIYSCTRVTH